jgi:hypothetical protein
MDRRSQKATTALLLLLVGIPPFERIKYEKLRNFSSIITQFMPRIHLELTCWNRSVRQFLLSAHVNGRNSKVGTPPFAFPISVSCWFGQSSTSSGTSPFHYIVVLEGVMSLHKHFFLFHFIVVISILQISTGLLDFDCLGLGG